MGNIIRINKRFFMLLTFGILLCSVCMGRAGMPVRAETIAGMQTDVQEDVQPDMQTFIIDAQMLPSDQSAYEIQLKVENQGQDWEGTVRLMLTGYYGRPIDCAYDTVLSLPQGSTKQFVVGIPKDSIDRTDVVVQITLLDKNSATVAKKEFERLLQTGADALNMGILSDEYRSLTYLDMGGTEFDYNGKNYPIRLVELNPDKLEDSLNALSFLVIDSYNTGVLSDKALESIMQWMDNGGMLIIGTGSRAEEVLAGFDGLEVQCVKVDDPGEGTYDSIDYVDVSQLHMAELVDVYGIYKAGYDIFGLISSWGSGAVGILPYSLAEAAQTNAAGDYEQQKSFVEAMLHRVSNYSNPGSGSGYTNDRDSMYILQSLCRVLGNGRLQFGVLKLIVILYVIFAGPILYLILRFAKKRELYWIAVPVTTLVGVFLMYWAGRGFEVVSTKVYSVTIENLSDRGDARTYLRCYDAGHKEWELRLAEGYEYAGPAEDTYFRSSDDNYYYHIRKEGDRIFFGVNPSLGFEDGYFQAGTVREPEEGGIYSDLQWNLQADGQWVISGTVTNETNRDFRYFAVFMGDDLFVYNDLPAGSVVKLEETKTVYDNDGGYHGGVKGYGYGFLKQIQGSEMEKDADILTALGMGLSFAYSKEDPNMMVIIGVTEDWDKAVDDNCSEVSYGCLYAVQ